MYILLIRSKVPWDAGKEDEHKTQCHTQLVTMGTDASYMNRLLSLNKKADSNRSKLLLDAQKND